MSRPLAASCGSTSPRREASAKFALLRGAHAAFDCRISQLPNAEPVVDYFRWRSAGAHRNALNGHCYWLLRKQGKSTIQTTTALLHLSVAQKNELLFQAGINFNDVPLWHKRGIGLYWETYEKPAYNPKTGEPVAAVRRRLQGDYQLPMKERYSDFIATLLAAASSTMHGERLIHSREEQQP